MSRRIGKVFLLVVILVVCMSVLFACNNKVETSDVVQLVYGKLNEIGIKSGEVSEENCTVDVVVINDVSSISLAFLQEANTKKVTYAAYSDESCSNEISTVTLSVGKNVFYVVGSAKKNNVKVTVTVTREALPHTVHTYGEWVTAKEATCTTTGVKERTCTECGDKQTETLPALGHTPQTAVKENIVAATCETAGSYDSVIYCERCDMELSRETIVVDALGHDYDYDNIQWDWDGEVVKAKVTCKHDASHVKTLNALVISQVDDYVRTDTATIEVDGKTYEGEKSERVNYNIEWTWNGDEAEATVVSDQGQTDYSSTVTSEEISVRSCTTDGKTVYKATFVYDGVTYTEVKTVVEPATGHAFGNWIIEKQASCTEEGVKYRICNNDPTHIERESIAKTPHMYGEWITTKEATETENGVRQRTCSNCGYVQEETFTYEGTSITEYSIEYRNLFGSTHTNPTVYTRSTNTITLTAPTERDGYTFSGWFDQETGGTRITTIAKGSSDDKILYAQWTARSYTITYNNAYGAVANPASYTLEDEITFLAPSERNGYSFREWQDEDGNVVTGIAKGTKGNRTFTAIWNMHTYTITYQNTQGATNENPAEYNVETATITLSDLSLTGYDFVGWFDQEENGNKVTTIQRGSYGTIILYARYTAKTFTVVVNDEEATIFTVSFDGNGAEIDIADQTITATDALVYPDIPSRSGYIFAGWYDNAEGTGNAFDFSADLHASVVLYAKWISNTGNTIRVGENKSVYISGTTQVYYYFVPLVTGSITTYSSSSLDTYGYLYQNGTQLTTNDDGGSGSNFSITYNVTAGLLYAVSVRGYSSSTSGTVTLYLTGTAKPADSGKADVATFTVTYGEEYDFGAAAQKPGYNFVGYYTEANKGGTRLTSSDGKSLAVWTYLDDMNVFAGYEPTKYTITFDAQGGSEVESMEFGYNEAVTITARPTLSGKSFAGWFLNLSDEEPYAATTMPAENFTLYAKWINYNLNDFTYNTEKLAVKVTDELTAALFEAVLLDTDGEEVEITASIVEGEQIAGTEISVRLLANGKYNKRKSVTIDNIKVYAAPTLTYDDTRDYINLSEELNGVPFTASGEDSFGQATVITAEIAGEYQGGDVVSVVLKSTDPAGNVTSVTVQNVKVYDKPIVTYDNITAATEADDITLAFFSATAEDNFGVACEVNFAKSGEQTVGGTVTVTLTSEDEKGNVTEIIIEVKIYGNPTINNVQKVNFKTTDEITVETLGASATDTHGGEVANVTVALKSGAKVAGQKQVYTVTAVDLVGNVSTRDFTVKIFGIPTVTGTKTAIKDIDDVEDVVVYGMTAKDSFGKVLTLTTSVEGEQTAGETIVVTFTATDDAGNTATLVKNYVVLSADDITITYNPGQSDVIKLSSKGEEFTASATDSVGSSCEITVLGATETLTAGTTMNIILRATDAAGNTKDSAVIENVSVYAMPTATYKKHTQWYLTSTDGKTNLFRITDSFGEELYTEETKVSESDTEYVVRVVADPDEAGNVFDQELTIVKLAANTSVIDLYVNGTRIGSQIVTRGEEYNLPCPTGYRYVWKIDDVAVTDEMGASLAVWDEEDGGYTATADVEIITYTITYHLDGGENDPNNPVTFTVDTLRDGINLYDGLKIISKEYDWTKIEYLGDGLGSVYAHITENVFLGWYTEPEMENEIHTITACENIEVYAKWSSSNVNADRYLTEQIYKRDNNYIYFGTYPQTQVTNSATKSALSSMAGTLPTSSNSQAWTSYGYYINGSVTNFMWYIDLSYNGEKYRGVYFTSYRPYYTTSSSSTSNSYQDDNGYNTSTVYWFKYDPIKWRILSEENGEALILCEMIIDSQDYYYQGSSGTTRSRTAVANYNDDYYAGNGSTVSGSVYDNNYQYSAIRKWLNEKFYSTAFSDLQKALIQTYTVKNDAASTTDTGNNITKATSYVCADTQDKVFLLSEYEVTNSAYGFSSYSTYDTARQKKNTDYAKCQGVWTSTSSGYVGNGYWWLRSPYCIYSSYARLVYSSGRADDYSGVYHTDRGVVPALKIRLS